MSAPPSPVSMRPLRSALKDESERTTPVGGSNKAVQISEPDLTTPEEPQTRKQYPASKARRLSGRLPVTSANASRSSLISQMSLENLTALASSASPAATPEDGNSHHHHHPHYQHKIDRISEKLLTQVAEWLQHERAKKESRRDKKLSRKKAKEQASKESTAKGADDSSLFRVASHDSHSSEVSLDRLQHIIEDSMAALGLDALPAPKLGRRHKKHRSIQLHRTVSASDTEYQDGEPLVPSCDAVLDNSKTMSYSGGGVASEDPEMSSTRREEKEREAWIIFKNDILRLAHTLRLKGWRRVPLDSGETISVKRLSGALTNAVYVVAPPPEVVASTPEGKRPPAKVLLRVYGPQVEQLINRDSELAVLRRLARKRIGPRLLGTFKNGRFEQFFNAITLTPTDLRIPDTSKQIAKRMRELHDGIELLDEEIAAGPAVLQNWDHWQDVVEKKISFLDDQIRSDEEAAGPDTNGLPADAWRARGPVCGVEWPKFKAMVSQYRHFLNEFYGGERKLCEKLVFAHNDTQHGNILRIQPDDEKSPLMQPAKQHKRLIVIDFEYAGPNLPGLEFANHFTEWTYDYLSPVAPYACHTALYPSVEEQRRFIKAYVEHRPDYVYPGSATPKLTPLATPTPGSAASTPALQTASSTSSIVEFMLDARVPPGGWGAQEKKLEEESERQVKELMHETRLWRIANSAMWVAWGIVQAKIPGLKLDGDGEDEEEDGLDDGVAKNGRCGDGGEAAAEQRQQQQQQQQQPSGGQEEAVKKETYSEKNGDDDTVREEEQAEEEADEFDYISYAQERAWFFWGDCVLMGLVKKEDLPTELQARLKLVNY
ncbi:uncharacterized protein E0L32_005642 [Thyridium curvatum]|uniref:Choline kinase N-terminal domain-containing protein n=1 Tax=Thyridium curvatum TaxID=1093900 RepID=A0A507AVE4_9PEZI|nr:uncharacterized protein E0L32_005642 [Thyridium curvatum]TPX13942.1 hypothetical protein E0L32_005642 [Thyridium curvatum]